jgi:hypothetical protein
MHTKLIYVELKSGYNDDGPAWIGYGVYNRTGRSVYFNGQVFRVGQGIAGNHFEQETGDEYWISGVKKNGSDRLFGNSRINIDREAVADYLQVCGLKELPKNKFNIVELDKTIVKEHNNKINNKPLY